MEEKQEKKRLPLIEEKLRHLKLMNLAFFYV